ncbi:hypothetical protein F0562_020701 [Nyssa sinensis]|uniref:Uncharacterized protein n=1 Tax=Nyssa sinensis TaxID=561372 RepID=A0A5J5BSL5_9ASTE|nr:hypothetical protein F0562_020701 [Nyssa sinensis]
MRTKDKIQGEDKLKQWALTVADFRTSGHGRGCNCWCSKDPMAKHTGASNSTARSLSLKCYKLEFQLGRAVEVMEWKQRVLVYRSIKTAVVSLMGGGDDEVDEIRRQAKELAEKAK